MNQAKTAKRVSIAILIIKSAMTNVIVILIALEDTPASRENVCCIAACPSIATQISIVTGNSLQIFVLNIAFKASLSCRNNMVCKPNCKDNSQCGDGEVCIKGECQSGCMNDDHCKEGEKCYEQSCVQTCEDGICPENMYCHIDDKVCLLPCESDKNCAGGYKCFNGHCLQPCRNNSQCSNSEQYCHK